MSFVLTQKSKYVSVVLQNHEEAAAVAAAKPPIVKVLLNLNTDSVRPKQDKVPLQQKRDFGKANQVTRGNNPLASVLM